MLTLRCGAEQRALWMFACAGAVTQDLTKDLGVNLFQKFLPNPSDDLAVLNHNVTMVYRLGYVDDTFDIRLFSSCL